MSLRSVSRRARRVGALGLALAATLAAGVGSPAQASENGQWWYDLYDVPGAHADGWTGAGMRIAVIDAAINPDLPVFDGADLTVDETPLCGGRSVTSTEFSADTNHGSTVTAMLIGNGAGGGAVRGMAPDAAVTFYGWGDGAFDGSACALPADVEARGLTGGGWALERALDAGAQIVTTSVASGSFSLADENMIARAIADGVVFISGIANDAIGDPFQNFPNGFNGVVTVNAFDAAGDLQLDRETGEPVINTEVTVVAAGVDIDVIGTESGWDSTGPATGSSLAAPLVAGMLALTGQKYPDATGNQLVQSLIHNTWADDHELEYDPSSGYGYGAASLGHLLRVDPTQYPDENPIMNRAIGGPSAEQIEQFRTAAPSPTTDAPVAPAPDDDQGMPGWATAVVIVAVVVLVVIVGAIILTVVLVRRSKKNTNGGTP